MRMPEGNNQIEVWSDIVGQISLFFNGMSLFSACVAKAICADLSFRKCHWITKNMDTLLYLIKAHVKATKLARNCCKESLNLINRK